MPSRRVVACVALALAAACAHRPSPPPARVAVRILAINDFHGQLEPGKQVDGVPAGGAAVLASWLRDARSGHEGATLLVSAGDLVGASPPSSSLLRDEPTISFLGQLGNDRCAPVAPDRRADAAALARGAGCDVVAALGNHELDHGIAELRRLALGGARAGGPSPEPPWPGARFPFVSANVLDARTGAPVFPPAVVREVGGVRVGVVGAVLRGVPDLTTADAVDGLAFVDPADAVNQAVRALAADGVHAIVVLLHDGGRQERYAGPTRDDAETPSGPISALVARLDGEVDVVVSGHAHAFTNARLPNAAGRPVLVTQALSAGTAFACIDLGVDARTGEVAASRADVLVARADAGPGRTPDARATALVASAQREVAPILGRVVARAAQPVLRGSVSPDDAGSGESALGDLVADAFRAALATDVALVQPGAVRADLAAGPVTWGALLSVLPFGDAVVPVTLTGRELRALLEMQWLGERRLPWRPEPYVLHVSGLRYAWDASRPQGARVLDLEVAGVQVEPGRAYRVAVPSSLAGGVDQFPPLGPRGERRTGPRDVDALAAHVAALPQPVTAAIDGRIARR